MRNASLIILILLSFAINGQSQNDYFDPSQPVSETYTDSIDGTFRIKNLWLPNGTQTITNGFGYREYEMWGQIRIYYYQNGLPNGPVFFYDSTKTILQESGSFKDDEYHGLWTEFYDNGQIKSIIEYNEGQVQSSFKTFYESGQLKEEYQVTNGRYPNGKYKSFYESGVVRSTGEYDTIFCICLIKQELIDEYNLNVDQYKNSIPVGCWTDYYPNGQIKKEYEYSDSCSLTLKLDTISSDPAHDLVIRGSTLVNECPTGTWKTYDEDGDPIEVIVYKSCEMKLKRKRKTKPNNK